MYKCNVCNSIFEEELAVSVRQDYSKHNILTCCECGSEDIENYHYTYEDLNYEYENAWNDDEREYFKKLIKDFEENYKGDML